AEDGIRDFHVTGVQTCALPILIFNLIKREVVGRYRGSVMGLLWSFFNPVFMLVVYTFVFSVVFRARWLGGSDSKVEFALVLFTEIGRASSRESELRSLLQGY